ncbi:RNB-domain-containing protein [Tilletiaria anomala UBC 951]|uniref:Ribosomal RNA-processing protein 44 n=1 Tax=Tilletiaria anomala (strain ATCC 24038 / CBS 436.72 / UBC 951) TaxID=1037660 RepID=A0A066WPR4_TILAU|nr:RNB-domain-containing protein [Tilletiaria anomala UBC 951]KDN52615.1 RNB-domain-containing protein [Tilletiaria anomala UBC 951]
MTGRISILKRPLPPSSQGDDDGGCGARHLTKFQRKTAKGKVLRVVRERYLRSDLGCGHPACASCAGHHAQLAAAVRSSESRSLPLLQPASHGHRHLLIDTNVVLHQIDLLEATLKPSAASSSSKAPRETPAITSVILLQTVLDEVRHRSLPLFNRLQALIREPERNYWVYWNDFSEATAIARTPGESPNDTNDRAIRAAAQWYAAHFRALSPPAGVMLLSDDADNVRKARQDGIDALSVREYIQAWPDKAQSDQLFDLLAARSASNSDDTAAGTTPLEKHAVFYPDLLDAAEVTAGITSGALHSGFFNASPYNYLEATIKIPRFDHPVLLVGRQAMNRAVDGDIVAIEILPESEWRAAADAVLDADKALRNDDAGDAGDGDGEEGGNDQPSTGLDNDEEAAIQKREEEEARRTAQANAKERRPTGRVVGIVKRNWRSYVAHIDASSVHGAVITASMGQTSLFATPVDRKVPRVRIRTRQAKSLLGQKILIAIDDWLPTSRYPDGHFVRALGATESKEAEQESLLLEHGVSYRPFSQAILDCLPPEGDQWKVPPKELGGPHWRDRVDLREENICSIDPPGCQDIDDALHAKELPNGNIEAGVHIADVSYFVKPQTPMDAEAASRSTTVYLVDKRIDMLPALLGTNLCSLRPHVERLAFSVIWELTPDAADIVSVRFHKSVIASKAAFTYEEAQKRKDDVTLNDAITRSIRLLNTLAIKLKQKRHDAGALNLASPEVRIHLDSQETTGPIDVEQKEMRETNSLVEEFMLLANISVAQRNYQSFPQTTVLRRHGQPPSTNFEVLADILQKKRGMHLDASSSKALATSLDACVDPREPAFNTLVRIMATRCMLSAEYFCSGSVSHDAFGHYGLACGMYTHFTSPIRRYADVLAHRQLAACINYSGLHPNLHSKEYVEDVLRNANQRHRAAQFAGRASVEFYVGLAIARKNEQHGGGKQVGTGQVALKEEAFVIRTFRNGVAVFVNRYGLEGLITFDKDCAFDAENYQVTIPKEVSKLSKDITIGVFDKCMVELGVEKDRNTQRGKVKMALLV